MANGTQDMPDQTQNLLALGEYTKKQSGNGKPAFAFGWLPMDMNVGGGLGLQSASPFSKPIPGLFKDMDQVGGLGGKFFKAIRQSVDDLSKAAKEAGVMYSGDITNGAPPISGLNDGGSFASMISASRSDTGGNEVS